MNLLHRWYCSSDRWAGILQGRLMPWVLDGVDLGDSALEIGPGPGLSTDWLRPRVPRLTTIEVDERLAQSLKRRMDGTNVTVVKGDATSMPFPDGSFSGAVCFTMLHHVPSRELQNRLFSEVCRVLRPGGIYVGSDSTPSFFWRLVHIADTAVPIDPETLQPRLEAAGFTDVSVNVRKEGGLSFRARKPA